MKAFPHELFQMRLVSQAWTTSTRLCSALQHPAQRLLKSILTALLWIHTSVHESKQATLLVGIQSKSNHIPGMGPNSLSDYASLDTAKAGPSSAKHPQGTDPNRFRERAEDHRDPLASCRLTSTAMMLLTRHVDQ